jgi:hypothetical protein
LCFWCCWLQIWAKLPCDWSSSLSLHNMPLVAAKTCDGLWTFLCLDFYFLEAPHKGVYIFREEKGWPGGRVALIISAMEWWAANWPYPD